MPATIGCWMLPEVRPGGAPYPVTVEVVGSETPAADALTLGVALAASADRVGLLVMGDGSAALTPKAPRYVVEGAKEWQRSVDQALGSADIEALAALSDDDARRYWATGRVAWQVLAGAARAGEKPGMAWRATLLAAEAPYGVGYTVAAWERVTMSESP